MSTLRLLHYLFLGRALLRGPRYLAGYALRRAARQPSWKATRNWR